MEEDCPDNTMLVFSDLSALVVTLGNVTASCYCATHILTITQEARTGRCDCSLEHGHVSVHLC